MMRSNQLIMQRPNAKRLAYRTVKLIYFVEDSLLVGVLLSMIVFATLQVLLRNLLGTSLTWIDPALRVSVLWIAMLGAMIASRKNEHITIDIADIYVADKHKQYLAILHAFFTSFICMLVCYFSFRFVQEEYEFGSAIFGQIPVWIFQVIIPIGFFVISIRYAKRCLLALLGKLPQTKHQGEC